MGNGFGANFWGFFVLAAAWCVVYFVWAVAANRREAEDHRRHRGDEGPGHRPGHDEGGPVRADEGPGPRSGHDERGPVRADQGPGRHHGEEPPDVDGETE